MNILFVHQSFPGQYQHIINALALDKNNKIVGMGIDKPSVQLHKNVYYIQYGLERGNTPGLHDWLVDFDSKFIRGEALIAILSLEGFTQIYAHIRQSIILKRHMAKFKIMLSRILL